MPSVPSNSFDFQNFFSTTLTSDITAGTLTLPVAAAPTPSEGILVIDPDSATPECIFYTSKGASSVTCPADGRGWESTTAASHLSGTTVIMAPTAYMLRMLKTGSLYDSYATGWVNTTAPSTITASGNHIYSCVVAGTDLTSTISPGTKLELTRTVAAPTQCTSLNGTTQYYSKSSPAGMTFTDDFVVSAWIKVNSYKTESIVSRYNGTSGWDLHLESSGQVRLEGFNAGAANESLVQTYQSVPLNKWVHITAQLDMSSFTNTSTTSYIMIDGVDVPCSVTRTGTNPTALIQAGNLEIGSRNGGTQFFDGKIAQVAIYSAKVTQANVLATISQGLSGSETSLVSAYSFNNSKNDLNANANNLTANGSAVETNADSPFGVKAGGTITSTLCYAEVLSSSFSTDTTLVVRTPDGVTIPTSGGITSARYSTHHAPYGCPRIENVIGHIANVPSLSTTSTSAVIVPGATVSVYVPSGRRVKVTAIGSQFYNSGAGQSSISIYQGATVSALTTLLNAITAGANTAGGTYPVAVTALYTPAAAGTYFYSIAANATSSGTTTISGAQLIVELV